MRRGICFMIGTIKLSFTEENVVVDTSLEIHKGIADKCFVIETVCRALQLEGAEKRAALLAVATKDLFDSESAKSEDDKNEG